ncbi:MAG: carbohydrate kinase family protein [Candidatus Latescibacterota bacterium]
MWRIGVIGSINRDTVSGPDGQAAFSLGGVLYTALALGHLAGPAAQVLLLARLGEDVRDAVLGQLASCPQVRLEGLHVVARPTYRCHIRYQPDGSKVEVLSGGVGPLQWEELAPHVAGLDGLLVNFITGFELGRRTLQVVRERLRGPLIMDFHSLALGRRRTGERFWRRPNDWATWVGLADAVQMNQEEAAVLCGRPTPALAELAQFARRLLALGPQAAVVTLGERGALACRPEGGGIREFVCPVEATGMAVDPTGCGDVFLAALGLALIGGKGLGDALEAACRAAGVKSRTRGLDGLHHLRALAGTATPQVPP